MCRSISCIDLLIIYTVYVYIFYVYIYIYMCVCVCVCVCVRQNIQVVTPCGGGLEYLHRSPR
jgi:hypothetical protein